MKQKLSFVFLFLLGLAGVSQSFAQNYDFSATAPKGQTLYYKIMSEDATIGNMVMLTHPDTVNSTSSSSSSSVSDRFWINHEKPTGELIVPGEVTYKGTKYIVRTMSTYVFAFCNELTVVHLPSSITSIPDYAFYANSSSYYGSNLTTVTKEGQLSFIGSHAFAYCRNLTSIGPLTSLNYIGDNAFYNCTSLRSIEFPNSLNYIGSYAFSNSGLEHLYLPDSISFIGQSAFANCSQLLDVTMSDSIQTLTSTQSSNSSSNSYIFSNCTKLKWVHLSESLNWLLYHTFDNCVNLERINLSNISGFGEWAFLNCYKLDSIKLCENLTSISQGAFKDCRSITSITIPKGVTSINSNAFSGCSKLKTLYLPNTLKTIKNNAFYNCISLTNVELPSSLQTIEDAAFQGSVSLDSIFVPTGVSTIGLCAFGDVNYVFYDGEATGSPWCALHVYSRGYEVIQRPLTLRGVKQNEVLCNGMNTGAVRMDPDGGSGNYEYSKDDGLTWQRSPVFDSLPAGLHTFWVSDDQGHSASVRVQFSSPAVMTLVAAQNLESVVLSASGGTGSYRYSMDSNTWQYSNIFNNVEPGDHMFMSVDNRGCKGSTMITVVDPHTLIHCPEKPFEHRHITCGQSFNWTEGNGKTYATDTIVYDTLQTYLGCDSILKLNLTIGHGDTVDFYNTACDYYTWEQGVTYFKTTTDNVHYTNRYGCDSMRVLHLTINYSDTILYDTAACKQIVWPINNLTYHNSGSYLSYSRNDYGCNRTTLLNLTIWNGSHTTQTAAACNSYRWATNGQTYAASGTLTAQLRDHHGCDSIVTLHLTVNRTSATELAETVCDQTTWTTDGNRYTESGDYRRTLLSKQGCDSTVTLHLTVLHSSTDTLQSEACDSYYWPYSNQYYSESGTYRHSTPRSNGCDSIKVLRLTVHQSHVTRLAASACDSYVWGLTGVRYTETGTRSHTLRTQYGCDSTIRLALTINRSSYNQRQASACDQYLWSTNGTRYATDGIYRHTMVNQYGCDSTEELTLTIHHSNTLRQIDTVCDQYTWQGYNQRGIIDTLIDRSGRYTAIYTNHDNCDSTVTLSLTVHYSNLTPIRIAACDEYHWSLTNTLYTVTGNYSRTLQNQYGCDSTVRLALTINHSNHIQRQASDCDQYLWVTNGTRYTTGGVYTHTMPNQYGCDSTEELTLTIRHSSTTTKNITACDEYQWQGYNQKGTLDTLFDRSGNHLAYYTNQSGCDSTVRLFLTVHYSNLTPIRTSACDSFYWHRKSFYESVVYDDTLRNVYGCDSVARLILAVNYSSRHFDSISTCDRYYWNTDGHIYRASGDYSRTVSNQYGCDSIIHLSLEVRHSTQSLAQVKSCDQYYWQQRVFTYSGIYYDTISNVQGCDSVMTLMLTVNPNAHTTETVYSCEPYTWPLNGRTYVRSTYNATVPLTTAKGCDSIITLNLFIRQADTYYDTVEGNGGYLYGQNTYTSDTMLTSVFKDVRGCDSAIRHLFIHIVPQQDELPQDTIVNGHRMDTVYACDSYTWHGQRFTESGVYVDNATYERLYLVIKHSHESIFHVNACDKYTWVDHRTYYASTRRSINLVHGSSNGCDSIITLKLTIGTTTIDSRYVSAMGSYTYKGVEYTQSTILVDTLTNAKGCDSIVYIRLTVRPRLDTTVTACDSYTWDNGTGETYTRSGNYYDPNTLRTLHLTIKHSTDGPLQYVEHCAPFELRGVNYYTSRLLTYTSKTIHNAAGCDTTERISLHIQPLGNFTLHIYTAACQEYYWHGRTYTKSGIYTYESYASGCYTVDVLHLTMLDCTEGSSHKAPKGEVTYYETACDYFLWDVNGHAYTESGIYKEGSHILNLTIKNSATYDFDTTIYSDRPISWHGNVYGIDTIAFHVMEGAASNGCDSIDGLYLHTEQPVHDTVTICDSYKYPHNGEVYTESGVYEDFPHILHLTIKPSTRSTHSQEACYTYTWDNGQTYTASTNTVTRTLTNAAGCDSVIKLNLTIHSTTVGREERIERDYYTWINGRTYRESTTETYRMRNLNSHGCDSIALLHLRIIDSEDESYKENMEACDSYTWSNGQTYTASGEYLDTTTMTMLELIIHPSYVDTTWMVAEEAFMWSDGKSYRHSTIATQQFISAYGCDSTLVLVLTLVDVDATEGIDEIADESLSVYPNPAIEKITVEGATVRLLELHALNGVSLRRVENSNTMPLSGLPTGGYMLRVTTDTGVSIHRIIKK